MFFGASLLNSIELYVSIFDATFRINKLFVTHLLIFGIIHWWIALCAAAKQLERHSHGEYIHLLEAPQWGTSDQNSPSLLRLHAVAT